MSTKILAIGDLTIDQIMAPLQDLPRWGEEAEVHDLEIRLGGNTGNFALTANALGLEVACMGPIGRDSNGRWVRAELERHGLTTKHLHVCSDLGTSVSVALVKEDGERLFVTYPGALAHLENMVARGNFPAATYALFSGWCQPPRVAAPVLAACFDRLRARGTTVVIDLAWSEASWLVRDQLFGALSRANIVIMNIDEAAALTGRTDLPAVMESLRAHLGADMMIIVKRGSEGAMLDVPHMSPTNIPAFRVAEPRAAVGTGDSFNAGFLHALAVQRLTPVDAAQFGCDVASWQLMHGRKDRIDAAEIRSLRTAGLTRRGAIA
ncbi:sugar/nucleoside kinase (ribokinase family) [Rhizobium sp. BK529]|uniref:carbohydrate kinase family protein n=1 Tax=Rhizobium sp. BK529 TaxID=2586983 RepID=UPI00160D4B98|nr:carbohydrate kinase family protein [Rhizobium sp. BK529]MBB3594911.1 sugar/nucleoside kinase (ribokinase family) [Rhizobium sp. BK529]